MLESEYQARLIRKLRRQYPNAIILKNDTDYLQGIPDLLVLEGPNWAALEVKASQRSPVQPNQEYYIDTMDDMSFADFIYPDSEEEVLDALQQTLRPRRSTRVLKP